MKAQASAEFMISLGIMLLLFLLISGIASQRYEQARHERVHDAATAVLTTFVLNLNAIVIAGDGASLSLALPVGIDNNDDYSISILPSANMARITFSDPGGTTYYDLPLVSSAVTGRTDGINGTVTFQNMDGEVLLA